MKKAFTLAEIMIVLTVIGILTAILLPVAFHSTPDEAAMKFKKANANLGTLVREMVSSEKYYKESDVENLEKIKKLDDKINSLEKVQNSVKNSKQNLTYYFFLSLIFVLFQNIYKSFQLIFWHLFIFNKI